MIKYDHADIAHLFSKRWPQINSSFSTNWGQGVSSSFWPCYPFLWAWSNLIYTLLPLEKGSRVCVGSNLKRGSPLWARRRISFPGHVYFLDAGTSLDLSGLWSFFSPPSSCGIWLTGSIWAMFGLRNGSFRMALKGKTKAGRTWTDS